MVNGFEREYRSNSNMFVMSYEELYYNNGFEKIVNYLNIDSVKNIDFPYGEKYRLDKIISNKLI
jgi:tryptophan synthase alpha subunit